MNRKCIKKVPYRKIHGKRIYKTSDLAKTLNVCQTTIWNWRKKGLPVINPGESPPFFRGKDVKVWLSDQLQAQKRPLKPHEFWCVKEQKATIPVPKSIKLKPLGSVELENASLFNILATCQDCGFTISKFSHVNKLDELLIPHGTNREQLFKMSGKE